MAPITWGITGELSGWWFGTMEFYDFPIILGIIINPTDELTFFRGVVKPPTSYGFIETATGVTNIKL